MITEKQSNTHFVLSMLARVIAQHIRLVEKKQPQSKSALTWPRTPEWILKQKAKLAKYCTTTAIAWARKYQRTQKILDSIIREQIYTELAHTMFACSTTSPLEQEVTTSEERYLTNKEQVEKEYERLTGGIEQAGMYNQQLENDLLTIAEQGKETLQLDAPLGFKPESIQRSTHAFKQLAIWQEMLTRIVHESCPAQYLERLKVVKQVAEEFAQSIVTLNQEPDDNVTLWCKKIVAKIVTTDNNADAETIKLLDAEVKRGTIAILSASMSTNEKAQAVKEVCILGKKAVQSLLSHQVINEEPMAANQDNSEVQDDNSNAGDADAAVDAFIENL